MLEDALLSGFLMKQGEKGIVKGWKKRWFIVTPEEPTQIRYQKKISNAFELGHIDLTKVTAVKPSDRNEKANEWAFNVDTPNRRYNLLAPDEESMQYWICGIEKVFLTLHFLFFVF